MSAAGKILTGFSKPYVAKYTASGSSVSYSDGQLLARGVSVSLTPESGDDNNFYADNIAAETLGGVFTGAEVTLGIDGLLMATEKFIFGLPTADTISVGTETVDVYKYGDNANPPYVGIGYIERYMQDGVTTYRPTVLRKCRFNLPEESAETQGEDIDWQSREYTASVMRDDGVNHEWKWRGADQATELAAENAVRVMLGMAVLS